MVDYSTKKIIENGKERKIKTPLSENVEKTREVVREAGRRNVSIEGEIGVLAGQEEDIQSDVSIYPTPEEVLDYVQSTGIDAVAIACGTCHGPVKKFVRLEEKLLMETEELFKNQWMIPRFVLHGSSTIPQEMIREFIESGGEIENASGVPMEAIKKAIMYGVRKINIDTDLRLGITTTVRRYFLENKGVENESEVMGLIKKGLDENKKAIDPRDYLGEVMKLHPEYLRNDYWTTGDYKYGEMMYLVKVRIADHVEKLVHEFGSAGLAEKVKR
jgi:fructose-bisphosphate aldolase class II